MAVMLSKKPELKLLTPYITCKICKGYFIDATTVTECLHTFCRSCIVKHFKKSLFCPECDVQVERGCPLNKLRPDPRKQLLVYKVVPRLHENEVARQWNFLKQNQPNGVRPLLPGDLPQETVRDRIVDKINVYSPEDKISLSVEYDSGVPFGTVNGGCPSEKQINAHKRYLQCPAALTVYHLKKFIRLKYEINNQHKIMILYEGEQLSENTSLMDVAYQFFYEAKSPMRFTYRIIAGVVLKSTENFKPKPKPLPAKSPPTNPSVSVRSTPSSQTPSHRHTQRGSASSAASSSDESTASTRRQQRQRSAKTAAYNAMEAMEESEHEEQDPPAKRRRLSGKSPRCESDTETFEPYTVYRNTRRTPKATLDDLEARYNLKPERKRVYAVCSDDEELSPDDETQRNTLANKRPSQKYNHLLHLLKSKGSELAPQNKSSLNGKSHSKKADEDVYEFDAQTEDNDSNTTQEYDFVYDNSDHDDSHSENDKKKDSKGDRRAEPTSSDPVEKLNGSKGTICTPEEDDDMNEVDADEHELEQHIEMEVITDTDDIDQHIEDSIEEVEVDAEDERDEDAQAQADVEAVPADEDEENDSQLEAETTSSTCLVIAEDEDDDGVVEEVIAAEEDGHELVVVEDPDESDVTYTVEVFNVPTPSTDSSEKLSEDASRSSGESPKSKSPTAEEDEPEIVHERVVRKKSKKSKHHHHHHHHKRRRHHSPVMLISSPEEAPMKLTLKLRPTPSISPGSSSSRHSSKSPLPESPTKEKRYSIGSSPSRRESTEGSFSDRSYKYSSQKVYTVKITSPKASSPSADTSEKKFVVPNSDISNVPNARSESHKLIAERLSPKVASPAHGSKDSQNSLPSSSPKAAAIYPRPPTPASSEQVKDDTAAEKRSVPDEVKERLTQMRQVRHKISPNLSPVSSASLQTNPSACVPDLKSVKTPSSLTISKVEAGETPPRAQEPSTKPALEILMLPPSPPPLDKQKDDAKGPLKSSEASTKKVVKVKPTLPVQVASQAPKTHLKMEVRPTSSEQPCVLDLSDKTRRDMPKQLPPPSSVASSGPTKSKSQSPSSPAISRDNAVRGEIKPTSQQNLNMMSNPLLMKLMDEATIATMNRMNFFSNNQGLQKLPLISPFCTANPQPTPIQTLNEMYGSRQITGFSMSPSPTRPGPNQSVRHIPNPSALLHRQQSMQQTQEKLVQDTLGKQQGQLTEEQLKARLVQFQQNRAARANYTYSRVSSPANNRSRNVLTNSIASGSVGGAPTTVSSGSIPMNNLNNNLLVKSAVRSRSIEKVAAGLLSVRAGAYAVEAQVGH